MLRLASVFCICLTTIPAFCQSKPKYQVGTVTGVESHLASGSNPSGAASYDVSVKVGNTVYVVLYTSPLGEDTVKYTAGRDLLVVVGKSTVTYHDILGRSFEFPIESQEPYAKSSFPKPVSSAAK